MQLSKHKKSLLKIIIEYLFPPVRPVLTGKLVICGEGRLEFELDSHPEDVCIYFTDDAVCIPCNPGEDDCLKWRIIEHHGKFKLIIEWCVCHIRTVIWKVC